MAKSFFLFLTLLICVGHTNGQVSSVERIQSQKQSFGIGGGLILLENPFVFYPVIHLSYSKGAWSKGRHQLQVTPQAGIVLLPAIETKFLFSLMAQYKYISEKRFEAGFFTGVNYQLRQLKYNRFEFNGSNLKSKGRYLHQFGPLAGISAGYKLIKRKNYSISPNLSFSLIKLNKNYSPAFLQGFKPLFSFGTNLNTN